MTAPETAGRGGAPTWALLALAAALLAFAGVLARSILAAQPLGLDFLPMWTGARVAAQDPGRLYDVAYLTEAQRWLLGGLADRRPFPYPPSALLVFAPFGRLPFWPALVLWTGLGVTAFLAGGLRLAGGRRWLIAVLALALPATVSGLLAGQSVFLVGGLAMAALSILDRRPFAAGVLLGVAAAIKPSLLLAAPFLLAAAGQWRALAAAALAGAAMVAASALTYGVASWRDWLGSAAGFQAQVLGDPRLLKLVVSPSGLLQRLGLQGPVRAVFQLAVAAIALGLGALAFRSTASPRLRALALFGAGLMATPYAMNYDTALLAPAAAAALEAPAAARPRLAALAAFLALALAGFPLIGAAALAAGLALQALAARRPLAGPGGSGG